MIIIDDIENLWDNQVMITSFNLHIINICYHFHWKTKHTMNIESLYLPHSKNPPHQVALPKNLCSLRDKWQGFCMRTDRSDLTTTTFIMLVKEPSKARLHIGLIADHCLGKWAYTPPPVLLGEDCREWDLREWQKSSLDCKLLRCQWSDNKTYTVVMCYLVVSCHSM